MPVEVKTNDSPDIVVFVKGGVGKEESNVKGIESKNNNNEFPRLGWLFNNKAHIVITNTYLDVRCIVGGQVDVEAVVVVVVATQLLIDQNHPMMPYRLARLNDGTHRWQGRHIPLNMATWVIHCRLDEWTVVFYVQDTKCHLIFWIYVTIIGKDKVLCYT